MVTTELFTKSVLLKSDFSFAIIILYPRVTVSVLVCYDVDVLVAQSLNEIKGARVGSDTFQNMCSASSLVLFGQPYLSLFSTLLFSCLNELTADWYSLSETVL